ncbi:hypothetical protein ACFLVZ_01325 [Chloroflexota bacterium]
MNGRLSRLKKLYLDGDVDEKQYERERAKTKNSLSDLEIPQLANIEDAGKILESFDEVWAKTTLKERKTLLRMMLEKVNVVDKKIVSITLRPIYTPLFVAAGKVTNGDPGGHRILKCKQPIWLKNCIPKRTNSIFPEKNYLQPNKHK